MPFDVYSKAGANAAFATAAQGALADTATQPGDLGTAAASDVGDFATAAQGAKADTAVQPAALAPLARRDDPGTRTFVADLDNLRRATNSPTTWVTPDATGVIVHPSVLYFPDGWNGSRWWAAATPYFATNSAVENPCIYVSEDGLAWTPPAGVTNPLVPMPSGAGYNSDTHLVEKDGTLYLFFREYQPSDPEPCERIKLTTSADGATWSAPVTVMSNTSTVRRLVSPSAWFDRVTQQWVMLSVDIIPVPFRLVRHTATNPLGPWTETTAPTLPSLAGAAPWHLYSAPVGDRVLALIQTGNGAGGPVWLCASSDAGLTFTSQAAPLVDAGGYRSCFVPEVSELGLSLLCYFGTVSASWGAVASRVLTMPDVETAHAQNTAAGTLSISPFLAADTFNRADTAAGLGTATSGHAWTPRGGTLGIASGKAYATAAANTRATLSLGTPNHKISALVTRGGAGNQAYVMARFVDSSNYLRWGFASTNELQVHRITADVIGATHVTYPFTATTGALLELECVGSTLSAYVNGLLIWSGTETQGNTTGTFAGIQTQNTASRFDDVLVKATT